MSAADVLAGADGTAGMPDTAGPGGTMPGGSAPVGRAPSAGRAWLRYARSELALVFRRRRNQALFAVVFAVPVIIGVALWLAGSPRGDGGGGGPAFFSQVTGNGLFLSFAALTVLLTLVLPLVISVVSGDSIAGEAGYGTLRYLLTVPAGRTRLLLTKYLVIAVFALCATALVTVAATLTGLVLFPVGPMTLLSGTTVSIADGILRLTLVTLYVAAAMTSLGAIGLAISTFTEHAIGAIAATAIIAVASEVIDNVPQFRAVHPYLPTHWWTSFDSLLRMPIATSDLLHGLLSFCVYAAIFCGIAWARFTSGDVTC
jgi:ABC-2 type transport system permease protein